MGQEIEKIVGTYITADLLDGHSIGNDENLLLGGMIDSLGVMRLVSFLEKNFMIKIPPDHVTLDNFVSVDAISTYLRQTYSV